MRRELRYEAEGDDMDSPKVANDTRRNRQLWNVKCRRVNDTKNKSI